MNFRIAVPVLMLTMMFTMNVYALQDCSQAINDTEVLNCSTTNKTEAEALLNTAYANAQNRIDQVFISDPVMKKAYLNAFIKTQRAWLKFRDLQCALKAHPAAEGSNLRLDFMNQCITQFNTERSKTLQEIPYEQ
ncbi:DUF1311 domain-containing protein [Enterobacteriaceae bacterium ESL0689]|nr:DUF1311 domain-containing protein [Enterobacteriaceae bacterium ESL0689]